MKNLWGLLTRCVLLLALVTAVAPTWATQTVCVLGNGKTILPMVAKCGMSCCAHKPLAMRAMRDCCAAKRVAKKVSNRCGMANMGCRCETRLVAVTHPVIAALAVRSLHAYAQAAVLPQGFQFPLCSVVAAAPGIYGVDAGPPGKAPRSSQQPRAPPVSL